MQAETIKEIQGLGVHQAVEEFRIRYVSALGYELRVVRDYQAQTGAEVYLVGHPEMAESAGSIGGRQMLIASVRMMNDAAAPFQRVVQADVIAQAHIQETDNRYSDQLEYREKNLPDESQTTASQKTLDPGFAEMRQRHIYELILVHMPELHIGPIQHNLECYSLTPGVLPLYARLGSLVTESITLVDVDEMMLT